MASTEEVLDHHLEAFADQDLDEIMVDYTEESVVVTNLGIFRGTDEIEGLFEDLFAEFSHAEAVINVEEQIVEEEFGYIIWTGDTPETEYEFATDTFYIPDDNITFQTFAGSLNPKD